MSVVMADRRGCADEGADLRAHWGTQVLGARVYCYEQLDSTNLRALELARRGAPEGTVVIARHQTAGRGRLGRRWIDRPGGSLLLTVLVRAPDEAPALVTVAAALAAAEAVREGVGLPALVKWPNDVVVNDRKVAGVLAEGPAGGMIAVGVGMNVRGESSELPAEVRDTAGYLSQEAKRELGPDDLLPVLMPRLEYNFLALQHPGASRELLDRVRALDYLANKRVTVRVADRQISGRALQWADNGALVIIDEAGCRHELQAGEVTVVGSEA